MVGQKETSRGTGECNSFPIRSVPTWLLLSVHLFHIIALWMISWSLLGSPLLFPCSCFRSQLDHEINLCPWTIRCRPMAQNISSKGKSLLGTMNEWLRPSIAWIQRPQKSLSFIIFFTSGNSTCPYLHHVPWRSCSPYLGKHQVGSRCYRRWGFFAQTLIHHDIPCDESTFIRRYLSDCHEPVV